MNYVIVDGLVDIPSRAFKGVLIDRVEAGAAAERLCREGYGCVHWHQVPVFRNANELVSALNLAKRREAWLSIPQPIRELLQIPEPI